MTIRVVAGIFAFGGITLLILAHVYAVVFLSFSWLELCNNNQGSKIRTVLATSYLAFILVLL